MINALQIGNKYCYKDVVMVHGHFIDEGEDLVFSTNASRDGSIPVILGVVSKQVNCQNHKNNTAVKAVMHSVIKTLQLPGPVGVLTDSA